MKSTTEPAPLRQIRNVWLKWRSSESATKSITAMLAINAIMIADGERERRRKTISEDARRDREVAGR